MTRLQTIVRGISIIVATLVCVVGARASADTVNAELLVVLGTRDGGSVDPAIASEPLVQAFAEFSGKQLLRRERVTLQTDQPSEVSLPGGTRVRLSLLPDRSAGRYRVRITVVRPRGQGDDHSWVVAAAPGAPALFGGVRYQSGTLLMSLRLRP